MLKRISCLLTALVLCMGLLPFPATAQEEITDVPAADTAPGFSVFVNGVVVENAAPFVYEQTTYVSLRNVTLALCPDAVVTWEGDHAAVNAEGLYLTANPKQPYLQVNGRYLYLPYGIRSANNDTMVPVRDLAKALGAQVWWDANDKNIYITGGTGSILSGDEFYNPDALYWLSHIINAESGNQPLEGKIAVGNVIRNRVRSPLFPDTIYEVVTQHNQFTPVRNGSVYKDPNEESIIAAKLCLDGAVILPDALWFNRAASSSWAARNKLYVATIGSHSFYA